MISKKHVLPTLLLSLLIAPASLSAQEEQSEATAIYCGKVYIGNGQVQKNAYVVVKDGRIVSVSQEKPEDVSAIVDAANKVIIPGIVAADTNLSAYQDTNYAVTPDFVALEGFDYLRKFRRALSGGVTTAYLSPGRTRFISGQGSVVKLFGDDIVERTLKENACLRITLGAEANRAPAVFEPTPAPTSDNPLVPARAQYPSSRISQLTELRKIFAEAQTMETDTAGTGGAENEYAVAPLKKAATGELPLRIAAKTAPDLRNAIRFARSLGGKLTLENPYEIDKLLKIHDGKPLQMVFRMPVRPGTANTGGENRLDRSVRSKPENAVTARDAGMTVAIVPASDADLPDILLVAGIAIRLGMSPDDALRAITLDAAKVLGVDDRVGSLEEGKDADFLVLSGEPFAIGTMVEDTFVSGKHAWHRETKSQLLVIRAGRILTCEGTAIENGSIIVAGGKIKGVGRDLAIPNGAQVIDMGDSVIVPGFVDAYCHAGLSGDGTGIPTGAADQRLTDVIQHDDPMLKNAASAGLTTVLVSGRDSGLVSGRVAAIKTAAKDHESMVVKDIAGIRFVHDNIKPDGIKALESQINRGKAYIAAWKKYEKDLADWKAGKKKKPNDKPVEEPKEEAKEDPVTGTWECEVEPPRPGFPPLGVILGLKLEGASVTGTAQITIQGRRMGQPTPIREGKFEGGTLTLVAPFSLMGRGQSKLTAKLTGDDLEGTLEMTGRRGTQTMAVTGKRTTKSSTPPPAPSRTSKSTSKTDDGKPKKPKVNEALEPMRALLEKRIPAVVTSRREPAIVQVIAWFEKNKLPYVLSGIKDAVETPEILGDHKPAVLLPPNVVQREGKKLTNAAAKLSDHGLPVALVSASTEGARYLPLHAAHAIRYGMDPEEALKALTIYPARMFKLDDRVGSLKRGKDADFVVYSGSPFEMTSHINMVVVNGRIVVDNRKKETR
ncbi:MAG: amidohydrolase family protein [Planctomycetota bacterium]|jgi:imidazolonepropionase-like amidohydrolase